MLPETAAQWHAALNDFPSILFLLALAFELIGQITGRDSLKAAGFWTLVVGAAGAIVAVVSGLAAEESIEHGESVHLVMERHETLAITVTILVVLLAIWRIVRRERMGPRERPVYLTLVAAGVLVLLWTTHVGGTIVYEHGGGIPTEVLDGALHERSMEHAHGPGEEDDENAGQPESTKTEEPEHIQQPGSLEHEED